jgi:hypothetical protein
LFFAAGEAEWRGAGCGLPRLNSLGEQEILVHPHRVASEPIARAQLSISWPIVVFGPSGTTLRMPPARLDLVIGTGQRERPATARSA